MTQSGMTDQEFLKLKPDEANNIALGRSVEEGQRLRRIYREQHGVAIESWERPASADGDAVQGVGMWMIALGIIGGIAAFFFPVGVETSGLYGAPEQVANIDRIALRHMCQAAAMALFVGGCILYGAGHIARTARRPVPRSDS